MLIFAIEEAVSGKDIEGDKTIFWLKNNYIKCSIFFENNKLLKEAIEPLAGWYPEDLPLPGSIATDADFDIEIQWTGWLAPGKIHNGDNPIHLTKKDFILEHADAHDYSNDDEELILTFKGINNPFELILSYYIKPLTYFIRRQIEIRDPSNGNHYLQWIWPRSSLINAEFAITKEGGFGEPIALEKGDTGIFIGLEYPAGINKIEEHNSVIRISTGQEIGTKINPDGIKSEWTVVGITPRIYLKQWFNKYLDIIRVAEPKPYLLYNTWYDLRSKELVNNNTYIMNEQNLLDKIKELKQRFIQKYGIRLNAFVLDDGWDEYSSDWKIRKTEFPEGFEPLVKQLKSVGTELGLWFGLSGGYSKREIRIKWMKENGYEIVGDQLCVAGHRYKELLKQRITEMIKQGVSYFKWDGIQFSCSEDSHGHPVGIYSRRAVMEAIAELCQTARKENPNVFLNITSGTWLSPWWVKYANSIWMQGEDYDWADVPSISKRDAAITYRDSVLYEDYITNKSWFPMKNLMTHGIIKGELEKLGSETESIEDFANDVYLYFSRGIMMWELYITPTLLTDEEWRIIASAYEWAYDQYPILINTEMIGGNPKNGEAYGFVHFDRFRGIIVARNPIITPQTLEIKLLPSYGLDKNVSSLILRKIYPHNFVSPSLLSSGDSIKINLKGYETAIYQLFLLEEAKEPLLSGAIFDVLSASDNIYKIKIKNPETNIKLLNPDLISEIKLNNETINAEKLSNIKLNQSKLILTPTIKGQKNKINITLNLKGNPNSLTANILFSSNDTYEFHKIISNAVIKINGKTTEPEIQTQDKAKWAWYKINLDPKISSFKIDIQFQNLPKKNLQISASAWLSYTLTQETTEITFLLKRKIKHSLALPYFPTPIETEKNTEFLGKIDLILNKK